MPLIKKIIFPIFILTLFIFFFKGGPGHYSTRSYQAFWNLGHILFFSLLPFLLFYFRNIPDRFIVHSALAVAMAIILGTAVELLQSKFHSRQPDLYDLYRDIIGALFFVSFLLPSRKGIPKAILLSMQAGTIALIASQILPLVISIHDEHLERKQFPLLSGWETRFEIQRWLAPKRLSVDKTVRRTGKASMRVIFNTKKYSEVELVHFPRNWEDYSFFEFSVYNPSTEAIRIVCRIHDDNPPETGFRYEDRFKTSFRVPNGWHTYRINLEAVRHHPKNRLMNLQRIMSVSFFTVESPRQRIVNFDDIQLIN